ncbi:MAG TPA: amino acid adenylation domain-containing protein, partial [Ktedonobacteraceae bacterium]
SISQAGSLPLVQVWLEDLEEPVRNLEVLRIARQEARQPFDLARGPLLRVTLLHLQDEEHILLLTMHHIVSDGWSMRILLREVSAQYTASVTGKKVLLPPLPVQYADYAIWQRGWLQGKVLQAQLAYWRVHLANLKSLDLPTDHPRPPVQTFRGNRQSLYLPAHLSEQLKLLSQREGVTLFMTLLAAFQLLLARYTGQQDIAVGTPIANRQRAEIEGLIGLFVNTLVMRTDLSGNPTFRQLLARVREVALGAYTHQDLPFEQLVEVLQPERNLSISPLFQVMFALQDRPPRTMGMEGVVLSPVAVENPTAKFDIILVVVNVDQELYCSLEYNTDIFEYDTITRLLGYWQTLLGSLVASPERYVFDLPLLPKSERDQLLITWNATGVEYPTGQCIHSLFEAQAADHPDSVAIIFEDQYLTYASLDQRSNQLSHCLQAAGVEVDVPIGVCVERSLDMVIGILGILKAGGAYVPLDPGYPAERLDFIVQDAQIRIIITQRHLLISHPAWAQMLALCLDTDWPLVSLYPSERMHNVSVVDANLAYIIYTSGSTGRPKGVLVTHKNLVGSTYTRLSYYKEPISKFLLLSSFAFDSSVAGLFWTLCQGGSLLIPPDDSVQDLSLTISLIERQQISHVLCVPSFYMSMLTLASVQQCVTQLYGLGTVIVAGEACSRDLVELHSALLPYTACFNEYGPTEGTVWSSVYDCQSLEQREQVPIGRPLANVQLYILDGQLRPVPMGTPGELYLGGSGVTRGYLKRPDLTAERFLPHPWSEGERLYRTGDLARYLPDGNILYLGRVDQQVKVRGYRIELGEIEALINQHPEVLKSAAVVYESDTVQKQIVAYFVQNESMIGNESEPMADGALARNQVGVFQTLYDQLYAQEQDFSDQDAAISTSVWTSSYTNQPLAEAEVLTSVHDTVERVLALRPERVLEIGCGTGLLLTRIAPHCAYYCGIDLSEVALEHLRHLLAGRQTEFAHVSLHRAAAHEIEQVVDPAETFDTVIINEVVQHFPTLDYFEQVLIHVAKFIKPGG